VCAALAIRAPLPGASRRATGPNFITLLQVKVERVFAEGKQLPHLASYVGDDSAFLPGKCFQGFPRREHDLQQGIPWPLDGNADGLAQGEVQRSN